MTGAGKKDAAGGEAAFLRFEQKVVCRNSGEKSLFAALQGKLQLGNKTNNLQSGTNNIKIESNAIK